MERSDDPNGVHGRIAVVTGGAQGIGLAVARRLVDDGANVSLLDVNGKRAADVAAQLRCASVWTCDVRDYSQVSGVMERIQGSIGPIDILVNSAGIWRHTPVLKVSETQWDQVFAVNVKGTLFCSQAVAPSMAQRKSGKIVNIASMAGFGGSSDWSVYHASKAAVISLTLSLAEELAKHEVQVNAVCPGATQTPMLENIIRTERRAGFDSIHQPEEVADEVLKLVSPFDQTTNGRVVSMKPLGAIFGVSVR